MMYLAPQPFSNRRRQKNVRGPISDLQYDRLHFYDVVSTCFCYQIVSYHRALSRWVARVGWGQRLLPVGARLVEDQLTRPARPHEQNHGSKLLMHPGRWMADWPTFAHCSLHFGGNRIYKLAPHSLHLNRTCSKLRGHSYLSRECREL